MTEEQAGWYQTSLTLSIYHTLVCDFYLRLVVKEFGQDNCQNALIDCSIAQAINFRR